MIMTTESEVVVPVLRALGNAPNGYLSTGEVRQRVKAAIRLTVEDLSPLANRPDYRIDQVVRNLKSHKNVPGNPFFEGLIRDVPRGYAITDRGRHLLSEPDLF
jgi:hypothetical protein